MNQDNPNDFSMRLEHFEKAWQSGSPPDIKDCFTEDQSASREALFELVIVDLEYRWKRVAEESRSGEEESAPLPNRPLLEDYINAFPILGELTDLPVDVICEEYRIRSQWGERPSHNSYAERFAHLRSALHERLAAIDQELSQANASPETNEKRFPLRLNCPHCQNPIAVVDDNAEEEVLCPSCGSSFNLDYQRTISWQPEKLPTLGKFELLEAVGRGAFGTVYRARDTELDRTVAVKVPRSGTFANQQDEDRFIREARSVAQLSDPGIVPVHEVGRSDSFPYIVTDFVEGLTLSDVLTGRRFGCREAAKLVAKIADVLQHAHDGGIVHRDLKPSNIMLTPDDQVRVMDFGLAKRDAGEITMTVEGQVLGTPAYMAPEQAQGAAHEADRRSDVYSLGVVLFELLTGELPFRGNQRMLLHQVIHDEAPSPRNLNSNVPRDLETICLKCIAKEPERRYQTAKELAADLRRHLADEAILARPIGRIERSWRWCRRNPGATALALISGVAVLALVALFVGDRYQRKLKEKNTELGIALTSEEGQRQEAERLSAELVTALNSEERQRREAERLRDELERNSYNRRVSLAYAAWQMNNVARAEKLLSECPEKLRHWEWRYVKRLCNTGTTLKGHTKSVTSLVFSPTEDLLASASDRTIIIWNTETSNKIRTLEKHTAAVKEIAFSPDGNYLASVSQDKTVRLWDVHDGSTMFVYKLFDGATVPEITGDYVYGMFHVAYSPDGKTLATAALIEDHTGTGNYLSDNYRHLEIKIWSTNTGNELYTIADPNNRQENKGWTYGTAFTPNNRLAIGFMNEIQLWMIEGDEPMESDRLVGPNGEFAFSPNGNWIAYQNKAAVQLWDTQANRTIHSFKGHSESVNDFVFSPDGMHLATASDDQTVKTWHTLTGDEVHTFRGHVDRVNCVAFSFDGSRLASAGADGTIKLWQTHIGRDKAEAVPSDLIGYLDTRDSTLGVVSRNYTQFDVLECLTGENILRSEELTTRRFGAVSGAKARFNVDGSKLALLSVKNEETLQVRLWDVDADRESAIFTTRLPDVQDWTINRDLEIIALQTRKEHEHGYWVRQTWLWYLGESDQPVHLREDIGGRVGSRRLFFSQDGSRLAQNFNGRVEVWDVQSRERILQYHEETNQFGFFKFSPDSRLILVEDNNGVRCRNVENGNELFYQALPSSRFKYSFSQRSAFSSDSRRLAIGNTVWDTESWEKTLTLSSSKSLVGITYSQDDRRIATIDTDGNVAMWNAQDGTLIDVLAKVDIEESNPILSFSIGFHGDYLAWFAGREWTLYDPKANREILRLPSVRFSPDGRLALRWIAKAETQIRKLEQDAGAVTLQGTDLVDSVCFSDDGSRIAGVARSQRNTVTLWNSQSGQTLGTIEGPTGYNYRACSFNPTGTKLVVAWFKYSTHSSVHIYDVKSLNQEHTLLRQSEREITSVAYNGEGTRVATGCSEGTLMLWDSEEGGLVDKLKGSSWIKSVEFSPDDRQLLSTDHDGKIRLWDVNLGKEVKVIEAHTNSVIKLAFTPDGKRVASVSRYGEIKLWDTGGWQEIMVLQNPTPTASSSELSGLAISDKRLRFFKRWWMQPGRLFSWDATWPPQPSKQ